ncbi:hypothetical protein [Marinobacterium lutimaris]|uniref:Uncharacterized protein n=1 Tax=Marinobacterium lutimaris TaxID=568106 RepID=A0A1H6DVH4_9GAMM|nr:hypothetical protein [Marinobacterium lutimaris]SEG89347.1 hypothetical protein SAMN05444390_1124 [Marinobacterium lutimaris]
MASPKQLTYQLYRHWDIVEQLCRLSREMPAFEPEQAIAVINRFGTQDTEHDSADILRTLCANEILQPLSRSEDFQLNPLVLDFVKGLTREHELGLSAVLKARVEAIRDATQQVTEGIDQEEMDLLRSASVRLSDLFRQIAGQLDQDRHAILDLAEQAKSREATLPIDKRYPAVLEAYDQYVEPMNEMMDSGLGGTFYPYLEQAVRVLDKAEEHLSIRGALYTQRLQLRHVAQQAKELRRLGRIVAQQCADTLLPLREEARQHNSLSTAISELLGLVRKRGLKRLYQQQPSEGRLPCWQRTRRGRLQLGDEILELMAAARHFEPAVQAFPEDVAYGSANLVQLIDEAQVQKSIEAELPIENLMRWLQEHHGNLPDQTLLRLYHNLIREQGWQADLQPYQEETDLRHIRISYHPHRLTSLADLETGPSKP